MLDNAAVKGNWLPGGGAPFVLVLNLAKYEEVSKKFMSWKAR